MKCNECPCYIKYDCYNLYNNLMKEGDCEISHLDDYVNQTIEYDTCKGTQCIFKEKGFIDE